jgi:hypothetical protein
MCYACALEKKVTQAPKAEPVSEPKPEHADLLLNLHKQKISMASLRRENDALTRALEESRQHIEKLGFVLAQEDPQPVEMSLSPESGEAHEAAAVVAWSDWHVEEPIEPEKVNDLNEYSMEIAEERIQKLVEGVIWNLRLYEGQVDITTLVIWLGGDFMSGYIHEELVETNAMSPIETVLWLRDRLIWAIDRIVEYATDAGVIERILLPCSHGNHGRATERMRISTGAENSYEWLLYQLLSRHYQDHELVEVHAPKGDLLYLRVFDWTIRFTHGDKIRYQGGVGGLSIPLNKAIDAWNAGKHADVTVIGHWHQYTPGRHAVVNGSLCGYGPYALSVKARYEPPQQAFFLVDAKRGMRGHTPLWVTD